MLHLIYLIIFYSSLGALIFVLGHLCTSWIKDLSRYRFGLFISGFLLCLWVWLLVYLLIDQLGFSQNRWGIIFILLSALYQFYFMIRNIISGIKSRSGILSKIICVFWFFAIIYWIWFTSAYYISCESGPCKRPDILKSMIKSQAFVILDPNKDRRL